MNAMAPSMSLTANTAAPIRPASQRSGHAAQPTAQADNGFARCLDQARENVPRAADATAQRPNADKPPSQKASHASRTADAKAERSARAPGAARAADKDEAPPKEEAAAQHAPTDAGPADPAHDDAAVPGVAAPLPAWAPLPAPAAAQVTAAAADGSDPLQAAAPVSGGKASSAQPRDDLGARAPALLALTGTANTASDTVAAPPSTAAQAATSEQRSASPESPTSPLPTALPSPPVAATTTTLAPKAAEALLPTATLPSPIDSPMFAPALATQVRWWTNDGVQQAQLLLNPAEMGPVRVNIVLDGREARIDFSADLAATRGAIEAALPVLAAALDDGGLKLTGGGVHDGSAQRQRDEWNGRGVTHRTSAGTSTHDADAPGGGGAGRSAPGRGIVDLVA
jgi:flagellar hook-length control protein FliK